MATRSSYFHIIPEIALRREGGRRPSAPSIFDHAATHGLTVTEVTLWETETSFATDRAR